MTLQNVSRLSDACIFTRPGFDLRCAVFVCFPKCKRKSSTCILLFLCCSNVLCNVNFPVAYKMFCTECRRKRLVSTAILNKLVDIENWTSICCQATWANHTLALAVACFLSFRAEESARLSTLFCSLSNLACIRLKHLDTIKIPPGLALCIPLHRYLFIISQLYRLPLCVLCLRQFHFLVNRFRQHSIIPFVTFEEQN